MSDPAVGLRPEEEWVRQLISAALDVRVDQHDDGSLPGMYDLDISHRDQPRAAVEVTAAADQESIEIWNLMNGGGRWCEEGLVGGWMVELHPQARAKRLRRELPDLLRSLELQSVTEVPRPTWHVLRRLERTLAEDLGVVSARQGGTDFPGSIYVTLHQPLDQMAGFVSESGEPLVEWLGTFLRGERQGDVLDKLARSGATERHAFVLLPGFTTAPFVVQDLLMRDDGPVPSSDPDLPDAVTHVWAASTWSTGDVFHWDPNGKWRRFSKDAAR